MEDPDKEEELVIDIDSCDEKNSLAVVEYIDDIYHFHKKSEVSLILFTTKKTVLFFDINGLMIDLFL